MLPMGVIFFSLEKISFQKGNGVQASKQEVTKFVSPVKNVRVKYKQAFKRPPEKK